MIALVVLAIVAFNLYLSGRPEAKTVKLVAVIRVPGPFKMGRPFVDYLAISGARLYAGYASRGLVAVLDTTTNQVIATVDGLPRASGVAVVAERNLGFASARGDNTVGAFDLTTHRLLQRIPAGNDPDAIVYDEKLHLVYVGDQEGKTGTLIDPGTRRVVDAIALGGEPEYAQADPESGLIYQNLKDTSEVVVVDPEKQAVTKRYKIAPGEGPTGLAFDAANRRLFSACRNKNLIVLNADSGEVVAVLSIGGGVDGADYDPALRRVYTANAFGTMTVIQQDSADQYHVLENAPTPLGGHSLVVDRATHRIYVAYFGSIAVYEALPQPENRTSLRRPGVEVGGGRSAARADRHKRFFPS
jgi:DNA-binding beta-propeller fold protein YncE